MCLSNPSPMFVLIAKKIIRIITFSHYLAHTEPLFMSLEILPLEKIFYHRCGLMMYKYHNNLLPCSISQLYAKNDSIHNHNTRCGNLLRVPHGSKSFTNVSARIWNVLNNIIDLLLLYIFIHSKHGMSTISDAIQRIYIL